MTLAELNHLPFEEAHCVLSSCCGSDAWARAMAGRRPFESVERVDQAAEELWWSVQRSDWLQAFSKHPKIGQRSAGSTWSTEEQKGMEQASKTTADTVADLNETYLRKFGFIFIVCATGKTADEMRLLLEQRVERSVEEEIQTAAAEQAKITQIRLHKLFDT